MIEDLSESHRKKFDLIYSLAPQMEDYYKLVSLRYWVPLVGNITNPNINTSVFSTDAFGIRDTVMTDGSSISLSNCPEEPVSLIFGGSSVFGVGSSTNETTISSELCRLTEQPWINFGVRSFNITQNLVHFILHQSLIKSIKKIVLVIGRNEIASFIGSLIYPRVYGTFAGFTDYMSKLNTDYLDMENNSINVPTCFLDANMFHTTQDTEKSGTLLTKQLYAALSGFKVLAQGLDVEIILAVQPMAGWSNRPLIEIEKTLLPLSTDLISDPKLFEKQAYHYNRWWGTAIHQQSTALEIPFIDINHYLEDDSEKNSWLFIDDCHMTDQGYRLCAKHIYELINR